jgi:hypothetical protein
MRGLMLLSVLALTGCAGEMPPPPVAAEPVANHDYLGAESLRKELDWWPGCCGNVVVHSQGYLIGLGERAFPAYDVILADPKSKPDHVEAVCGILTEVEADRRRFVPLAVLRVTAPDALVCFEAIEHAATDSRPQLRLHNLSSGFEIGMAYANRITHHRESVLESAIMLLGAIGDDRDASVLVPCLSNDRGEVRHAAADALAKIGGWQELKAMDAVLKVDDPRRDANEVQHLKACRDKLEVRLKANPIPKHLTN